MKNKLGAITLSIISAFALCGTVEAATLSIGSDSTTAGALNKSVSVELKDDDLKDYSKVEFQLSVDGTSYAELGAYSHKITSLGFKSDNGVYTIGTDGGELFAATVGSISYKTTANLNSNFRITPTNVKFYKKDGSILQSGDSGIKVTPGTISYEKEKSKDATLTNLTVSQGSLTPAFNKDTFEYTVVVKDTIPSIRVTPTGATGATITGGGLKSIQLGENLVEIIVTAEDGVTKNTYKIKIIRGELAEPSAYLKSLIINNIGVALSPDFDSKNNKYTVKIDEEIKSLNFKYETEDPLAEVKIEGNEDFKIGENQINITVTSSDGELTEVYEITAILDEEESTATAPIEEKKEEKKKTNWWLIILIACIIIFIIGGISAVLFIKNKKKKASKEDSTIKEPLDKTESSESLSSKDENDDLLSEDSITEILKNEAFDDEATRRFDSSLIKEFHFDDEEEEEYDDKTKEFNFKDLQ